MRRGVLRVGTVRSSSAAREAKAGLVTLKTSRWLLFFQRPLPCPVCFYLRFPVMSEEVSEIFFNRFDKVDIVLDKRSVAI